MARRISGDGRKGDDYGKDIESKRGGRGNRPEERQGFKDSVSIDSVVVFKNKEK